MFQKKGQVFFLVLLFFLLAITFLFAFLLHNSDPIPQGFFTFPLTGFVSQEAPICTIFEGYTCSGKGSSFEVYGNDLSFAVSDRCSDSLAYDFTCSSGILKGCVTACSSGCREQSCAYVLRTPLDPRISSLENFYKHVKRENVDFLASWGGPTLTATVSGSLIFSSSGGGFYILDARNPLAPVSLGRYPIPGKVSGLFAQDRYLYIGGGREGLFVYDVSKPSAAFLVGNLDTPDFARNVFISNSLLYLTDDFGGLRIIDISNPSSPREIGFFSLPQHIFYSVHVQNNIAYVTERDIQNRKGNLLAIDVSDPSKPVALSSVDLGWGNIAYGLDVKDTIAYVAAGPTGVALVDISSPLKLQTLKLVPLGHAVLDVSVKGKYAYASLGGGLGLKVIDVTLPSTAFVVGHLPTADNANVVQFLLDDYVALANDDAGLRIIDIQNPSSPRQVYNFLASSVTYDVFVENDKIYSVDTDVGVLISQMKRGSYDIIGHYYRPYPRPQSVASRGIFARDSILYVADGDAGLRILDARNPSSVRELGFYDPDDSEFSAIDIIGNLAYVSDVRQQGLRIIDISNPSSPLDVGHWFNPKGKASSSVCQSSFNDPGDRVPVNVKVKNSIAFLSAGRIILVDVKDPSSPREINRIDPGGNVRGLSFKGNTLVAASDALGLKILNIDDPCKISVIGSSKPSDVTNQRASDVSVDGDLAYLAYEGAGLFVYNISDLKNPFVAGYYDTPNSARHLDIAQEKIFLADADTGVLVLEYKK